MKPLAAAATAAPAKDYGKAETAATLAFAHRSGPLKGSSDNTTLQFVKAYCDGVSQKGVKATNRDMLYIASAGLVDAWQQAAALYCPVTMKVAG